MDDRSDGGNGALAGLRVLDLTGRRANFGVKLIADLGADVIKIEPPHGDPLRYCGPYAQGQEHPERSLEFLLFNGNKRGITLDLQSTIGQSVFRRLAATADVIFEDAPPGWMDERGIGYKALSALNSQLVYTAVTPYGQSGPRSGYRGSDISAQAIGGALFLTGNPGERPVRGAIRVADKMAGYVAATATVAAMYYRKITGQGQFVDVSQQEAVLSQMEGSAGAYAFAGMERNRAGLRYPAVTCPAGVYPCKDGWVSIVASKPHQWVPLRDWIGDERLMKEEYLMEPARFEDRAFIDPIVEAWTATMPKSVLFHEGQAKGIPIGESMRPLDVVQDEHLRERGYFVESDHPVIGEHEMPGAPFLLTETPWQLRRPAPLLAEHNREIYSELGYTPEEQDQLEAWGVI